MKAIYKTLESHKSFRIKWDGSGIVYCLCGKDITVSPLQGFIDFDRAEEFWMEHLAQELEKAIRSKR